MTAPLPPDAYPQRDADCAAFARSLGLPGYLDVHVHLLPERLQHAVWGYFDQLDDPPWPVTYRDDEAVRLATLRELGVVAHTALAYAHRPGVAAAIARGGRIAKVHLQVGRFHTTDPRLDEVWPQLAAAGIPALIHASAVYGVEGGQEHCGPDQVRDLLDRNPDVRVVVAHLGMPDAAGFLDIAQRSANVSLDTSMTLTDPAYGRAYPRSLLEPLAGLVGTGQLLFGSDFPTIPHPYAAQIRGLEQLGLDRAGLRALLHDNAARLLGRPAA